MLKLRPYQEELVNNIYHSLSSGHRRIIVQSPPRTGKTVVMAKIAHLTTNFGNRVMFIIHRKEVLEQAKNTFKTEGVDMSLTTMGMVQTLTRRVDKLPEPKLILIDEAHHALAKSYQRILNKFPESYVLYFTATPERTGSKQLDQIADDIIVGKSIRELTDKGFLAPFDYYSIDDIDTKKLKKSSTGDYTNASMEEAVSRKIYGHIVSNYQRLANGKQAVVFTYSVESAKEIADAFKKLNISAVELDGSTPDNLRDRIVKQFRDKKIRILVNVNLFTEGVDLPDVDCVIMARPTQSLALYLQFSMRCLNPREGKRAIIIDHVANWKTFGLPDSDRDWKKAIITTDKGKRKKKETATFAITQCDYCFAVVPSGKVKDGKCPYCGKPIKVRAKVEQTDDELKLINDRKRVIDEILHDEVMQKVADKSPHDLHTIKELQAYAKLHHYKRGWVFYQAKMKGLIKKRGEIND